MARRMPDEQMDVGAAVGALNEALPLQFRSGLQYTVAAAGVVGFEHQFMADRLRSFGEAETDDARRFVEKVVTLGGEPRVGVAPLRWTSDLGEAVDWLIESEGEAIDALRKVIPPTGNQGPGEALEHLIEHAILRKQEQVDFLLRARGGAR